jgi:hypothetical protein
MPFIFAQVCRLLSVFRKVGAQNRSNFHHDSIATFTVSSLPSLPAEIKQQV